MYDELVPEYRAPQYIPGQPDRGDFLPRMGYTQNMNDYVAQTPMNGQDSGLEALNQMLAQLVEIQQSQPQQVTPQSRPGIGDFLSELGGMYKEGIGDFLNWRTQQGPDVSRGPLEQGNMDALAPYFMGSMGIAGPVKAAASSAMDTAVPAAKQFGSDALEALSPILSKLKEAGGYIARRGEPLEQGPKMYERVPSNYTLREVWDTLIGQGGEGVQGLASKTGKPRQGGYAEAIARYLEPSDEAIMRDLALLFRKQPGKAWDLVHGEPDLFEMGVKGPAQSSGLSRSYSVMEPLNNLYDKAYQGVSDTASQVVNSLADKFPTAGRGLSAPLSQLVEQGGRYGADALSSGVDALKRTGIMSDVQPNWYAKTKGATRKRYVASGSKQAEEGADLWQRDVLKNMYRDVKPTYQEKIAPSIEEWGPVLKALSPLLGIPAIPPREMWGDAARLVGLGKDTISSPENPGLIESLGYLLGR